MYQQTLRRFAHFNAIQLSDPAPLSELILLALQEEDLDPGNDKKDHLKERIAEVSSAFCVIFMVLGLYQLFLLFSLYPQQQLVSEAVMLPMDLVNLFRFDIYIDEYRTPQGKSRTVRGVFQRLH